MEGSGKLRKIYQGNLVHGEQKRVEGGCTLEFPKRNTIYFVLWLLRNGNYELEGYNDETAGQQGKVKQKVQPYNFFKRRFVTNSAPPRISVTAEMEAHFLDMKIGRQKYHVLILLDITKNLHYLGTTNALEFNRWQIELGGIMQQMKKKSDKHLPEIAEEDPAGHGQMRPGNLPISTCIVLPPSRRSTCPDDVIIPTDITIEIEGEEDSCDDHTATLPSGSESRIKVVASIRMKRKERRDLSGEVKYEFAETKESAYMNSSRTKKIVEERSATLHDTRSSSHRDDDEEPRPALPPKKRNFSHDSSGEVKCEFAETKERADVNFSRTKEIVQERSATLPHTRSSSHRDDDEEPRPALLPKKRNSSHDPVDSQLTRHRTPPLVANKPSRAQSKEVCSANQEAAQDSVSKDQEPISKSMPTLPKSPGRPRSQHKEPLTSRPTSGRGIPPSVADKPEGFLAQATPTSRDICQPISVLSIPSRRKPDPESIYNSLPPRLGTPSSRVYENLPRRISIIECPDLLPSTCTNIDDLKKDQAAGAAGMVLEFQKADLLDAMLLVAVDDKVWFAGWRKEMHDPFRSKLHVGDGVFRINNQIVTHPHWAEECIKTSAQNEIRMHIHRLPRAKILDLKRNDSTWSWGLEVKHNEITSVNKGPATNEGLTPMAPRTISNKCCNWTVTEISSKTVPIVRSGSNQNLVKDEISALHTTLAMVVQPGGFIRKLAEALSKKGHSQFY